MNTKVLNIRRAGKKGILKISESRILVEIREPSKLVVLGGEISREMPLEKLLKNMGVEVI